MLTRFQLLDRPGIVHFQTKRFGGVSEGPYSSLNTSFAVGDSYDNVMRNRKLIAEEIGIDISQFVFCRQIHSNGVHYVDQSDVGRGVDYRLHDIVQDTDALITDISNVVLCIKTADCLPLFLYAPEKRVVGIAHIGWRGAVSQLPINTINSMQEKYGVDCSKLLAVVGVGCGKCCYEVSEEVANYFPPEFYKETHGGKLYLDLKEFVKTQLKTCGLTDGHIEISPICSICNSDEYFSSRAQNGIVGYGLSGIALL